MRYGRNYLHSEKYLERELIKAVQARAGKALKYNNPLAIGYPDRLVVLPGAKVAWVEMKSTGKKPDKIQLIRHQELRALGFKVYVIDSMQGIQDFLNEIDR